MTHSFPPSLSASFPEWWWWWLVWLLWHHRRWPSRHLCSWNLLGKNTGVGCHLLLHFRVIHLLKSVNLHWFIIISQSFQFSLGFTLVHSMGVNVVLLPSHVLLSATQWTAARPPCPSASPRVCPSSCPLHQWRHPTISSFDASFSFCP